MGRFSAQVNRFLLTNPANSKIDEQIELLVQNTERPRVQPRMPGTAELKDINAFVQIARAGSLTRAARETNIPKATLSHNLRRLEDALEVELVKRFSRGLFLTDAGRAYLENCNRIFDSCEIAASAAQRAHNKLSGKVRIAASAEFGTSILGAASLYLALAHAGLKFEVNMYTSETLLTDQLEFDCMIFVGAASDSSHMCRKMGSVSYGLYASPKFLREFGTPDNFEDVAKLSGTKYSRGGIAEPWSLARGDEEVICDYEARFSVQDYWMAKYFGVSGVAVAYLPDFFVHHEVELGGLVPVMPEWRSRETAVWVVYPAARYKNPRIKLLVDTLCDKFEQFVVHPGYSLLPQVMLDARRV